MITLQQKRLILSFTSILKNVNDNEEVFNEILKIYEKVSTEVLKGLFFYTFSNSTLHFSLPTERFESLDKKSNLYIFEPIISSTEDSYIYSCIIASYLFDKYPSYKIEDLYNFVNMFYLINPRPRSPKDFFLRFNTWNLPLNTFISGQTIVNNDFICWTKNIGSITVTLTIISSVSLFLDCEYLGEKKNFLFNNYEVNIDSAFSTRTEAFPIYISLLSQISEAELLKFYNKQDTGDNLILLENMYLYKVINSFSNGLLSLDRYVNIEAVPPFSSCNLQITYGRGKEKDEEEIEGIDLELEYDVLTQKIKYKNDINNFPMTYINDFLHSITRLSLSEINLIGLENAYTFSCLEK